MLSACDELRRVVPSVVKFLNELRPVAANVPRFVLGRFSGGWFMTFYLFFSRLPSFGLMTSISPLLESQMASAFLSSGLAARINGELDVAA